MPPCSVLFLSCCHGWRWCYSLAPCFEVNYSELIKMEPVWGSLVALVTFVLVTSVLVLKGVVFGFSLLDAFNRYWTSKWWCLVMLVRD